MNKDERIAMLEQKCQWAADQFEKISNAIADNSSAYAQTHAQSCAAEMDPDFDGNLQSPRAIQWKDRGGYYTYKNFQIHLIEAPDDDMPWELCEIIDGEYQGAIGHYDTLAEAKAASTGHIHSSHLPIYAQNNSVNAK